MSSGKNSEQWGVFANSSTHLNECVLSGSHSFTDFSCSQAPTTEYHKLCPTVRVLSTVLVGFFLGFFEVSAQWDVFEESDCNVIINPNYFDEMKHPSLCPANLPEMNTQQYCCPVLANEDTHHYLIFVGRRHAAVIKVVPLSVVFVLGVSSI